MLQKSIIFFFLFSLSFTAAFAVTEHLRLYVIASFVLIVFCFGRIIAALRMPKTIHSMHFLMIFFVLYLIAISIIWHNQNSLVYLLVYTYFYLFVFFAVSCFLTWYKLDLFLKYNSIAVTIVLLFVLLDFFLFHVLFIDVQEYIPRIGPVPDATVLGVIRRAYGFSNEPTNLSAYIIVFGGLAIFYWYKNNVKFIYFRALLILISLLLTFSGSAFGGAVVAIFFTSIIGLFFLPFDRGRKILMFYVFNFIVVFFFLLFDSVRDVALKFSLGDDFGSGRGENWAFFFHLIVDNNFMPHGLGSAGLTGIFPINSYLLVLYESGVVGLVIYLIFHLLPLMIILNSRMQHIDKLFLMLIYIASISQLAAFDTFYYPYTIIFISVILCISKCGYHGAKRRNP